MGDVRGGEVGRGRIRLLDVLRGLAILGTLGTNVWLFSTVGSGSILLGAAGAWWESFDGFVMALALFVTNGKFRRVGGDQRFSHDLRAPVARTLSQRPLR